VTDNLSRADLLKRLRGTPVSVETTGQRETISGRIVGVEEREESAEDAAGRLRAITVQTLTLLTDAGLVAVDLNRVRTLRLLDERLDREFREALGVLASGSDDQRRQLTLRFVGEAARRVQVGYVSEAPLWKMTYRLVLDDLVLNDEENGAEANSKPYLQGWALVENTTDEDWEDVSLSLVSGRPISFIQDLYQPLYVPRPEVGPDVIASPYPQTHGGDLLAAAGAPLRHGRWRRSCAAFKRHGAIGTRLYQCRCCGTRTRNALLGEKGRPTAESGCAAGRRERSGRTVSVRRFHPRAPATPAGRHDPGRGRRR
jgi:hypothetical protein